MYDLGIGKAFLKMSQKPEQWMLKKKKINKVNHVHSNFLGWKKKSKKNGIKKWKEKCQTGEIYKPYSILQTTSNFLIYKELMQSIRKRISMEAYKNMSLSGLYMCVPTPRDSQEHKMIHPYNEENSN